MFDILGICFIVFLTLSIFSYLYGDNPFYKIAEHIFVGVSAGYIFTITFWDTIWPNLLGRLFPDYINAGFEFDTNPNVTLEEDLARRDLTIYAIAQDEDGSLVDPFNGQEDIRNKKLI